MRSKHNGEKNQKSVIIYLRVWIDIFCTVNKEILIVNFSLWGLCFEITFFCNHCKQDLGQIWLGEFREDLSRFSTLLDKWWLLLNLQLWISTELSLLFLHLHMRISTNLRVIIKLWLWCEDGRSIEICFIVKGCGRVTI